MSEFDPDIELSPMAQSQSRNPERVAVVCPDCEAGLRPRVRDAAYKIRCPQCSAVVRVPGLSELVAKKRAAAKGPPHRREEPSRDRNRESSRVVESKSTGRKRPGKRLFPVTVVCPKCQSRQDLTVSEETETVECQLCSAEVEVAIPGAPARGTQRPAPRRRRGADKSRTYAPVGRSRRPRRERRKSSGFVEFTDEVRQGEPLPPPPEWTFFSGVFTFPWRLQMLYRWLVLSFFCTMTGWLTLLLWAMYTGRFGFSGPIMIFFALPAIWITLWTLSYGAAWCLCIVTDTAAGNDRIVNEPDDNWREWVIDMGYIAYILIEAEVIAYFVGKGFALFTEHHLLASMVTLFLVFPIILLSSMEGNTIWVPLTMPIVKSLGKLWWGWLLFYLLSGMLVAIWLAMFVVMMENFLLMSMMILGPLMAAFLFISARLLGRLAWKASLLV